MSALKEDGRQVLPEQLALRESVLGGTIGSIIIGGDAGTGTSGLARSISDELEISPENTFLVGQVVRQFKKLDPETQTLLDRMVDETQENRILKTNPSNPAIVESRLGPYLLSRARTTNPALSLIAISIELTAPKDTRMRRIRIRSIDDSIIDTQEELVDVYRDEASADVVTPLLERLTALETERVLAPKDGKLREFSLASITREEDRRKREDIERFRNTYPWFQDLDIPDPFFPGVVAYGKRVYDISIPTQHLTQKQVAQEVLRQIREFRQSEEFKRRVKTHSLPPSGDVFPA
jgi:cytidylate kinase